METPITIGRDVEPESTFPHLAMRASTVYRVNGPTLLFSADVSTGATGDAKALQAMRLLRHHHKGTRSDGAFT